MSKHHNAGGAQTGSQHGPAATTGNDEAAKAGSGEVSFGPREMAPQVSYPLWYRPHVSENLAGPGQPLAAIVTYVKNSRMVHLVVFDPRGVARPRVDVILRQPGDEAPEGQPYAEFPHFVTGEPQPTEAGNTSATV